MKRILSTLHHEHALFYTAQGALRECIFYDDPEHVSSVEDSLQSGGLGTHGPWKESEEQEFQTYLKHMQDSGYFHRTYKRYITAHTYDTATILSKLNLWASKYLDEYDRCLACAFVP
jgi:hypothetical protein